MTRGPAAAGALVALVALVAAVALGGCPGPRAQPTAPGTDPIAIDERDQRAAQKAQLEDDILTSYERDEPPDTETAMLDGRVGPARIGVGPGDVLVGAALASAPSRWPLDLDPRTPAEARSKRLEVHLSQDGTAAWASDEISWRIGMCGRTAVIPLRMTALFAREGDRWIQVFEHLSFGRVPAPARDGKLRGAELASAVTSSDLVDELSGVLAQGLLGAARNPRVVSTGPEALVLGPGIDDEWHAADILASTLRALRLRAEDRRVGIVGRTPGTATVAYWVGNFVGELPARPGIAAGRVRLRGTFVFERRRFVEVTVERGARGKSFAEAEGTSCTERGTDCRWVLVQGHVSQPIDDGPDPSGDRADIVDLATLVFGTALVSPKPLEVTCDDGGPAPAPVRAPAAAPPRRPAGGTR